MFVFILEMEMSKLKETSNTNLSANLDKGLENIKTLKNHISFHF